MTIFLKFLSNMDPFQAPVIVTSLGTTSDGGLRITLVTQELSDEDKLIAMKYHKQFGWMAFRPNQFSTDDLPKEQAEDKNKTPSKRLRAVLFVLWKQRGEPGDFEVWYRERIEKIITSIKDKLDDE